MLRGVDGKWIEEENELKTLVNGFYFDLFSDDNPQGIWLQSRYGFATLSDDKIHDLNVIVHEDEMRRTIFEMGPWKALGPYGFPAGFYQNDWSITGKFVCNFIKHLWRHPGEAGSVNCTNICLIPKIDKPEFVSQFHLISLCNTS